MKLPSLPRPQRPRRDDTLRDAEGRPIPDPGKVPTARGTWEEAALTNVAVTEVVKRQIRTVTRPWTK
jgi:hypothetical protein